MTFPSHHILICTKAPGSTNAGIKHAGGERGRVHSGHHFVDFFLFPFSPPICRVLPSTQPHPQTPSPTSGPRGPRLQPSYSCDFTVSANLLDIHKYDSRMMYPYSVVKSSYEYSLVRTHNMHLNAYLETLTRKVS